MQKGIIILIVFAALLDVSCKKNNSQPFQSYLKFKLNNVRTECNAHISATYIPATMGPDNIISISGNWPAGGIAIRLNEREALTTGKYIFQTGTWRSGEIWADANYYGSAEGGDFDSLVHGSGHIIITEINSGYVKGNFDFVTYVEHATNTFKSVTNGEFHIKRG